MPTGQATLDFGAVSAASRDTAVAVTGQATIVAASQVEAWPRLVASAEHTADEIRAESLLVSAGGIVAGTGFTIYGQVPDGRLWGTVTVDWVWL